MFNLKKIIAFILLLTTITSAFATPEKVQVGFYLKNIESINMSENNYYADLILWFKWKGKIDPTKSFSFANLMDAWGLTAKALLKTPKKLPDGSLYQRFHIEGKFYHKFWVGTFPLDWQKIVVELVDMQHTTKQLVYVPDASSSYGELVIPGWNIKGIINTPAQYMQNQSLGDPTLSKQVHPQFRMGVTIYRQFSYFILKIIPPIILVLLCSFLIFFLKPSYVDARFSTLIGTLLTAVFLQFMFTENLPNVGMVILIDYIFDISYIFIFLMLIECIYVTRIFDKIEALDETLQNTNNQSTARGIRAKLEQLHKKAKRIELCARTIFPAAYLICCVVVTILVRGNIITAYF